MRNIDYAPSGPRGPDPPLKSWGEWMGEALGLARQCLARGEVPVGAIIIDQRGKVLAAQGNSMEADGDPTAHAEMLALREAFLKIRGCRLDNCLLICTLEPCLMCAGAISHARLAGVVFGAVDPLAGAIVSRADYYDLPGARENLWHLGGIRKNECADLLRKFFASDGRRVES